jgi:hypothetical protein
MVEIKFSAQVASARDKWLKLSADETLETVLEFLRSKYAEEGNNNRRLGNLAAQTWIIRRKLENMPSDPETKIGQILENPNNAKSQKSVKTKKQETAQIEANEASSDPTNKADDAMTVINILEEVGINDMRFFAGSRVEVSKADADKLIKAGKAKMNAE